MPLTPLHHCKALPPQRDVIDEVEGGGDLEQQVDVQAHVAFTLIFLCSHCQMPLTPLHQAHFLEALSAQSWQFRRANAGSAKEKRVMCPTIIVPNGVT